MTRTVLPFAVDDMSALARSLRRQWADRAAPPGHLEMLNMLARAAGRRNFQQFRAEAATPDGSAAATPSPTPAAADEARVLRATRYFDDRGRLARWPARTAIQDLCLWALWARVPAERDFDEREVNALLGALHLFGDHALLRRTMHQLGLVTRTADGRVYRRVERPPTPDAAALIRRLRRTGAGG